MTRRRIVLSSFLVLALATTATAQDVVFVVRHAERADAGMKDGMKDPPLSHEGEARARRLASMLRSAEVEHVFASQFKRTQETAQPLAAAEDLETTVVTAKDIDALAKQLSATKGASLVVGHSDTVGDIIKALGVKEEVTISDDEYDNLFVVVRTRGEARLVRLRF